jgi:general secretion pathway protein J
MSARRRYTGFTLLELLVAMAIFAVVGTLALTGYTQLERQSEYAEQKLARLREVQRAVQTIAQDLAQLEPRPIREPLGDARMPALQGGVGSDYSLTLTRAGWSNTAGLPRPTLQRVGYRYADNALWRDYWPTLDSTLTVEPVRTELLKGVIRVSFRYMDANRDWIERWPPGNSTAMIVERSRPAAVELTMELEDWGEIKRLIELPG